MKTFLEVLMVVLPFFAMPCFGMTVSISDRGAVGDGKTMNTAAIQKAVNACAENGGGTVIVPAGTFLTGSVELKSHITLQLDAGAVLLASSKIEDYPPNGFKHLELGEARSLLWAIDREDVSIIGQGTIELADKPFFDWTKLRTGLPAKEDGLLADWQRQQCVVTPLDRPNQPIFFHQCRQLRLEGVTIRHSPCWTVTYSCCQDIQVHGIRIDNDLQIPNDDGIHFCGSKNIIISDCNIRAGDDCLAFTSITDPDKVCEQIAISNCILSSRSCAIHFGHRSGKVRDAVVSNIVIQDSNRGFAIQAGDGGWVENISISNVVMETKMFAGDWWGKGEPLIISAANSDSARIQNIQFHHVVARAQNSILVIGQKQTVRDVTFDNVDLTFSYSPNTPLYGRELDIAPVPKRPAQLNEGKLPWIYADNVAGLNLRDIRFRTSEHEKHPLMLDPRLENVANLQQSTESK